MGVVRSQIGTTATRHDPDPDKTVIITNIDPTATIYYKGSEGVSASSNDGNITNGQSLTLSGSKWLVSTHSETNVTFTETPIVEDIAVRDDLTVTDDATVTGDLAVTGTSALTGAVNYKQQVTTTGGAFATPIVLTEAQSGRVILLDTAAGLDFTLPAITASNIGMHYKFLVTVSVTSNSYRVTAGAADLLNGGLLCVDFDAAVTAPQAIFLEPDGSDDLIMTLNGTTSGGGKIGSWVEFTAITAASWFVHGVVAGDSTMVTPFS